MNNEVRTIKTSTTMYNVSYSLLNTVLNEYSDAYAHFINPMKWFTLRSYGTSYQLIEHFDAGEVQPREKLCFAASPNDMYKLLINMKDKLYEEYSDF